MTKYITYEMRGICSKNVYKVIDEVRVMMGSAKGTKENPGKQVAQKRGLNRKIAEQGWGLIYQQLAYKAEWAGRQIIRVDPRNTSKTCHTCGHVQTIGRKVRWRCEVCSEEHDRDINAAINILASGLGATGRARRGAFASATPATRQIESGDKPSPA